MIAEAGSRAGTGGTSTSPAPSIPRLVEPLDPVPRVPPREAVRPDPTVPRPLPPELPAVPPPGASRPVGPDEPGSLLVAGANGVCVVTAATGTRAGAALEYPVLAGAAGPAVPAGAAVAGSGRRGAGGAADGTPEPEVPDGGPPVAEGAAGGGAAAGGAEAADGGEAAGAIPQRSQKPSASTSPVQPGWVHRFIAASPSRSRSP
ncbi:hypothetical protein [Actinomadura chokoriensis]|uniref:Uncharacterized protein n=1 Tax=Actinomadura chokoriensis TaxID=454156 RepID=A0ABV4R0Y5_9ACTN